MIILLNRTKKELEKWLLELIDPPKAFRKEVVDAIKKTSKSELIRKIEFCLTQPKGTKTMSRKDN